MRPVNTFLLFVLVCGSACQQNRAAAPSHLLECKDNKTLVVRYEGEGDVVQFKMFEGLQQLLTKISPGVFEAAIEVPGCDDALFSYQIIVHQTEKDGRMVQLPYGVSDQLHGQLFWHGKNRSSPHLPNDKLEGKLVDTLVFSPALQANRGVSIYWPQSHDSGTPIVYCTDGTMVHGYAGYVDRLIMEGKIKPVIMVGVHSSDTHRHEEYVASSEEPSYFTKHERFFREEIIPNFEAGISGWHGNRYLYGFSNGAAFCMYEGIIKPKLFKSIIAYSTADYISEFGHSIDFNPAIKYPRFYMGAGRYEAGIFKDSQRFVKKMREHGVAVDFKEFVSGHDFQVWREEFLDWLKNEMEKQSGELKG
jgi:enterochelin esterase-like enzyme